MSHDSTKRQQLVDRLTYISNQNTDRLTELARQGIQINGASLIPQRIEYLVEKLVGDENSIFRLEFEIEWQERISNGLESVEKDARRVKLTQNTPAQKPGLIVPGK